MMSFNTVPHCKMGREAAKWVVASFSTLPHYKGTMGS